jgi:hypothetical protein
MTLQWWNGPSQPRVVIPSLGFKVHVLPELARAALTVCQAQTALHHDDATKARSQKPQRTWTAEIPQQIESQSFRVSSEMHGLISSAMKENIAGFCNSSLIWKQVCGVDEAIAHVLFMVSRQGMLLLQPMTEVEDDACI